MRKKSSTTAWIVAAIAMLIAAFLVMNINRNKEPSESAPQHSGEQQSSEPEYPKGLKVTVLQEGSGEPIENGRIAVVHYTGTLDDGTVFDSSVSRGTPFEFTLGAGQVIQGWDLGVLGMKVGEKRRLVIAPELAYGPASVGQIPPNSRLTFEVELLDIK